MTIKHIAPVCGFWVVCFVCDSIRTFYLFNWNFQWGNDVHLACLFALIVLTLGTIAFGSLAILIDFCHKEKHYSVYAQVLLSLLGILLMTVVVVAFQVFACFFFETGFLLSRSCENCFMHVVLSGKLSSYNRLLEWWWQNDKTFFRKTIEINTYFAKRMIRVDACEFQTKLRQDAGRYLQNPELLQLELQQKFGIWNGTKTSVWRARRKMTQVSTKVDFCVYVCFLLAEVFMHMGRVFTICLPFVVVPTPNLIPIGVSLIVLVPMAIMAWQFYSKMHNLWFVELENVTCENVKDIQKAYEKQVKAVACNLYSSIANYQANQNSQIVACYIQLLPEIQKFLGSNPPSFSIQEASQLSAKFVDGKKTLIQEQHRLLSTQEEQPLQQ